MEKKKFFRTISKISFYFCLLLFCNISLAHNVDSLFYVNPEYHVAKDIFNKKIVMLGDFAHHQPASYLRLYKTLYKWLEICKSQSESTNLTLIIEKENETAESLNKYLSNGNFSEFVKSIGLDFYLEDLEYYNELYKFSHIIDSINQKRPSRISFKIKGFEEPMENLYKLSEKEWELWFVKKRDSLLSNEIINYIKVNPNDQILMFYGAGHFFNSYMYKNLGFKDLTDEESYGYYLGYYLTREFGKSNIISYYTLVYNDSLIRNKAVNVKKKQDFITKQENLNFPGNRSWDLVYVCNCETVPNIDANLVCSKLILEKTLIEINKIKPYLPIDKAKYFYNNFLYKIFFLTGTRFRSDTLINEWIINNDFNEVEWLYSDKFQDTLYMFINMFNESPNVLNNMYKFVFSNYGIRCTDLDTSSDSIQKWKNNFLPIQMAQLRFTNSIGVFWLGYPDEKIKAKEYLVNYSGKDYDEPEKYLQWYRKNILGVNY